PAVGRPRQIDGEPRLPVNDDHAVLVDVAAHEPAAEDGEPLLGNVIQGDGLELLGFFVLDRGRAIGNRVAPGCPKAEREASEGEPKKRDYRAHGSPRAADGTTVVDDLAGITADGEAVVVAGVVKIDVVPGHAHAPLLSRLLAIVLDHPFELVLAGFEGG